MKKMIVAAAVAAMTAGGAVALRTIVSQSDPIFEADVEALTRNEGGPGCTGPKRENVHGNIFCRCENTVPCKDLYGCN